MATAKQAVADGKLDLSKVDKPRFGVLMGSGIGGIDSFEKNAETMFSKGPKRVSPFFIPMVIGNTASGIIAIELGAKGPNFGVVSACATGTHAIGEAAKYIELGLADVMLCGGSEAAVTPLSYAGFCNMRAMCTDMNDDPKGSSRPFDAKRSGFIMGEGSGTLLLESEAHAKARGARIYCELAGYGATCDAHHITAPHPEGEGLAAALEAAIVQAGIAKVRAPRQARGRGLLCARAWPSPCGCRAACVVPRRRTCAVSRRARQSPAAARARPSEHRSGAGGAARSG